uniref:Uncharacterized protein n=1 Tax=Romanomermis culicivorax TaxID=13658 RepID=A0A915KD83_ROMCU
MQSTERSRTERKFPFCSARLEHKKTCEIRSNLENENLIFPLKLGYQRTISNGNFLIYVIEIFRFGRYRLTTIILSVVSQVDENCYTCLSVGKTASVRLRRKRQ